MIRIKIGDSVKLKSGGTQMTVQLIENEDVKCAWFEQGQLKTANFPLHSLKMDNNAYDNDESPNERKG